MKDIYGILRDLRIEYERYEHKAVFTVEEAEKETGHIPSARTKNLFLRNEKGNKHYLMVVPAGKRADLKRIAEMVGEKKLSFASPERLQEYLDLAPGAVSPFGLINDTNKELSVLVDNDLLQEEKLGFHPNLNTETLIISGEDFKKFLSWSSNNVQFVGL